MKPNASRKAFACAQCRAHISVENTNDYAECSWCSIYYHKDYIEQVGPGGGDVVDMCLGCSEKEFP